MASRLQTADGAGISASESLPLIAHADTKLVEGCGGMRVRIGTALFPASTDAFRRAALGLRHLGELSTDLDFGGSPHLPLRSAMLQCRGRPGLEQGFNVDHCMAPTQISRLLLLAAAHFCEVAGPNAIQRCIEAPDRIHLRA